MRKDHLCDVEAKLEALEKLRKLQELQGFLVGSGWCWFLLKMFFFFRKKHINNWALLKHLLGDIVLFCLIRVSKSLWCCQKFVVPSPFGKNMKTAFS